MASSLHAQLAALSGTAGKHPGSTFAPNKRHEEAVGRGVNFNVQQGQIVNYRDFRFRATIIFKNSKEAADTPLSTLQENCQDALTSLAEILPALSATSVVLCGQEEASNTHIQQVLTRICILLGENDEQVTQNCLHVVEYLLRRYEIHQHLMEDLLWTFLPHHQQLPNIWHRCLLLVDLASHPSYLWLRPYADANRPAPTPRSLCARYMVQEIPLLRRVCLLVRKTMAQPATEPSDPATPLRGWSHVLSWTAACLVDGLVAQQDKAAVDRQALARILVPAVRSALRSEMEEYCSWGCVVASTLAECLDLSSSVLVQWGTALLENGAADPGTSWAALASMLLSGQDPQRVQEESYLPILSSSQQHNNQWVGCPLPAKVFAKLTPDCVGPLASLQQQQLEVTPLVVAILVRSMRANHVDLAVALLQEEQLADLWKRHNLVASVAAYVVNLVCLANDDDAVSVNLETGRAVLQTLCDCFSTGVCEKGVASAAAATTDLATLQPLIEGIVTLVSSSTTDKGAYVLPPRVALENPDAQVRRKALQQLLKDKDSFQTDNDMDDAETLLETLVRRWSVEPDQDLAEEFARAVADSDAALITPNRAQEQCQGILSAAHHWLETEKKNMKKLLSRIVEKAVHESTEMGESGGSFQQLQEMAICLASEKSMLVLDALGSSTFLESFIQDYGNTSPYQSGQPERLRQQRCALNLLAALKDPSNGSQSLAFSYLQILVGFLQSLPKGDKSFSKHVKAPTERITHMLSESPDQVVDSMIALAGLNGKHIVTMTNPEIRRLASCMTDPDGQEVSPLAVLLEAATRRNTPPDVTKKLIGIAKAVAKEGNGCYWVGVVPSLALLSHSDKGVRQGAVEVLSELLAKGKDGKWDDAEFVDSLAILEMAVSEAASMVQVGIPLTTFLARCMQQLDSDTEKVRLSFVQLAIHAVFSAAKPAPAYETRAFESLSWLAMEAESGTREAACTVLEAMEMTGEDAFPLAVRWKHLGPLLMDMLINFEGKGSQTKLPRLAGLVARQIKGVTVPGPQIVSSSGPGRVGARGRSYSVGNVDGVAVIRPYPKDMAEAVIKAIESTVFFRDVVIETVLESTSWTTFVFPHLDSQLRKKVVECLLKKGSESQTEPLLRVAASLPLTPQDGAELLNKAPIKESAFPYVASLIDLLKVNAGHLSNKKGAGLVVAGLFKAVDKLSKLGTSEEKDGIEFLLQSCLRAVLDLISKNELDLPNESLSNWVDLILSLLGAPRDQNHAVLHHLNNWRGRSVCLAILTKIASYDCKAVVDSVVDLSLKLASKTKSFNVDEVRAVVSVSVPLLWSNVASASRSMTSFVNDLLGCILRQELAVRQLLLRDLVKGMIGATEVEEKHRNISPGIISSLLIAIKNEALSDSEWNETILFIFEASPIQAQVVSLPFLVEISRQVLGHILGSPDTDSPPGEIPSCADIVCLTRSSREKESSERGRLFSFIADTLSVVGECVILDQVKKLLRKRGTSISTSSLKLWQNLLLIHATAEGAMTSAADADPKEASSWRTVAALAEECRGSVQANLPSNIFIAAVRSLLKEDVTADLRSRSLRFASDRVLDVDPESQERAVFIEFLSDAIDVVQNQTEDIRARQGALVYIEHTARTLFQRASFEKIEKSAHQKLFRALSVCSDGVKAILGRNDDFSTLDIGTWHLLASIALTSTTIIWALGIKALPKLGGLLKSFIALFSYANRKEMEERSDEEGAFHPLVQIAVLRLVLSSTGTAPQAMFSHLPSLLCDSGLYCEALRNTEDSTVAASLQSVDDALASKIPARLLIPALVKLICAENHEPSTLVYVFNALSKSLSQLITSEGALYRSLVTKAVLKAFEYKCSREEGSLLVDRAIQCILGLVLKLSEHQFRKMYGDLSEWLRQDQDNRRYAFWSLSQALAQELKTIFLPCASLVLEEMVETLNLYAGALCKNSQVEIVQGGRKKRKKSVELKVDVDSVSLEALLPLLGTVSTILRSDAQDGGKWTREHGRYHSLLEPLGKLLQSRIPEGFSNVKPGTTPFEYVVEENSTGSVVGCLTSLALAAGDEQLWKPLNHAVLEACGNSGRAEVRKGGVVCLLSLIRDLGEEFMVLLPECLPILAELLEDDSEIVSGLARDAVTTAEELLGESLEANLR